VPTRTTIDTPLATAGDLADLLAGFETCTWPFERWTHRAHLAVATAYLLRYPLSEATDRARAGIKKYNAVRGSGTGYHETITVLFMRLVARELRVARPADVAAFVNDLADRFRVDALLVYYSRDRLFSPAAGAGFAEPDLRPLDF
jgi:hypothetical protein